jgi:CheY-like chemotaxis protein
LGAAEYMTKPVDRERLSRLLEKFRSQASTQPVLVVEDDGAVREMLRRFLVLEGLKVMEATNGREALARVAEKRPSLILLDLMMPEMDGFTFMSEFRAHEDWRSIPVVVITAKDLTEEDRKRLNGAADAILLKGERSKEELVRELRHLVNKSLASASTSSPRSP